MKKDYSKNKYCKCKKLITNKAIFCNNCAAKERTKYRDMKGKNNPNFIDGRSLKKYYCNCGSRIHKQTYLYGGKQCRNCSKKGSKHWLYEKHMPKNIWKKSIEARKKLWINPRNHPRYIHGEGYAPYPIKFNNKLKESIRKRDDYTCQNCRIEQDNYFRKLDIHHIDYDKKNCKKSNLITLCFLCNIKANANRDYWYVYFKYLLGD
jgi:hypothetical protein